MLSWLILIVAAFCANIYGSNAQKQDSYVENGYDLRRCEVVDRNGFCWPQSTIVYSPRETRQINNSPQFNHAQCAPHNAVFKQHAGQQHAMPSNEFQSSWSCTYEPRYQPSHTFHDEPFHPFFGQHARAILNQLGNDPKTTVQEFARYFQLLGKDINWILNHPRMYWHDGFVQFAQKLPGYREYIAGQVAYCDSLNCIGRFCEWINGNYSDALADRFREMHFECERAAARQAAAEERAAMQREEARMQESRIYHEKYRGELHQIEQAINEHEEDERVRERLKAIKATHESPRNRTKRRVQYDQNVLKVAEIYSIAQYELSDREMNPYEFQLHTEYLDQLRQIAALRDTELIGSRSRAFFDAAGYGVALGLEANRMEHPTTATYWADVAWQTLDIAQAFCEGVALGCVNSVHGMVGLAKLGVYVVGGVAYAGLHPLETLAAIDRTMLLFAQGYETVMSCRSWQELNDRCGIEARYVLLCNAIDATMQHCQKTLATMSTRDMVKYATAFATELIIPAQAFAATHKVCKILQPIAVEALQAVRQERIVAFAAGMSAAALRAKTAACVERVAEGCHEIAAAAARIGEPVVVAAETGELIAASVADGLASGGSKAAPVVAAEIVEVEAVAAKVIETEVAMAGAVTTVGAELNAEAVAAEAVATEITAPELITIENTIKTQATSDIFSAEKQIVARGTSCIEEAHAEIEAYCQSLVPELSTIHQQFDGTIKGVGQLLNKNITMAYEHILGIDCKIKKGKLRLSGFHHDFERVFEHKNILTITDTAMDSNGIRLADLMFGTTVIPRKTFFPSHWSRQEVVKAIFEAYSRQISSKLCPDGKLKIIGKFGENIKIEMFVTLKGHITTAYPLLE